MVSRPPLHIAMMGVPDTGVAVLSGLLELRGTVEVDWLAMHAPVDPQRNQLAVLANSRGLPLHVLTELGDGTLEGLIRQTGPRLVLVVGFDHRIPAELLEVPELGFLNVHPSFLPRYRGANPQFWVLANGERETGVSLHLMDARFDTGPVVTQRRLRLHPRETIGTLFARINALSRSLVCDTLAALQADEASFSPVPQGVSDGTRAPRIRSHHLVVDFERDAAEVDRFVRAANPLYGMRCWLDGRVAARIWEVKPLYGGEGIEPGRIALDQGRVLVGTGTFAVELEVVSLGWDFMGSARRAAALGILRDGSRLVPEAAEGQTGVAVGFAGAPL